ncbi:MAG TPA: acetate/propionate family kinase [Candidatus Limnocylindrales bacterium]
MRVLVLNAGSSSLKASVVDGNATAARTQVSWGSDASRAPDRGRGLADVIAAVEGAGVARGSVGAVGHRVVHGGPTFRAPVAIDDATLEALDALSELAPLHNAVAVETIRAARIALPHVTHVACFDTAFHGGLPEVAARYPLPTAWQTEWGIRRYGFHGLSVAWSLRRAGELLDRPANDLRLVVAHLGSGCSVTAVAGGHSVRTSMGFTPLEGLMMGTRAGSIDAGIVLHLLRTSRATAEQIDDALEHRSGLLGVSGTTSDVRDLITAADGGDAAARLALDMFVDRAAAGIAAVATGLDGLDALVFTAGIGEHAGGIRAAIVRQLRNMGIAGIDESESGTDRVIAAGPPAILRIEAREDLVVAESVEALLRATRDGR